MADTAVKQSLIACNDKLKDACECVAAAKSSLWNVMVNAPDGSKDISPNDIVQFSNAYAQISTLLSQLLRAMINLQGQIGPIK